MDKPGILRIAAELGVSASTVSRALRPETAHLVSAERRKQILDLAEKQRFSPNPGARMLRKGVNSTLSVVVPLDESIFFSEFYGRLLAGTLNSATSRGWDVQIRPLSRARDGDFRETMQHLGLDSSGVIYLAEPLSHDDLEQLRGYRRPLVLTKAALPRDADLGALDLSIVGVDNRSGARSAVNLLRQLGHERIGLILGPVESRDAAERKQGYLDALQTASVQTPDGWILEGQFTFDGGRVAMETLLKSGELPTAVCCASDEIAFGAITALQAAGLDCPKDVSVIGFDEGPWATMARPALTTVRQPLADMAERAVATIVEATNTASRAVSVASANLAAALVIRDSTRAL